MAALAPHRRPHYPPSGRMAVLQLRAARGWSKALAGRRFLVTDQTVACWNGRIDEDPSAGGLPSSSTTGRAAPSALHLSRRDRRPTRSALCLMRRQDVPDACPSTPSNRVGKVPVFHWRLSMDRYRKLG
jgi:hypothetical protein